jgi:hypothetical protein
MHVRGVVFILCGGRGQKFCTQTLLIILASPLRNPSYWPVPFVRVLLVLLLDAYNYSTPNSVLWAKVVASFLAVCVIEYGCCTGEWFNKLIRCYHHGNIKI